MIAWIVVAASAGEAELELERGRVAYEREAYTVARDRAIAALQEAPDLGGAHQLYVDATTAAGLGSRGLFELVGFEVATPPWFQPVEDLREAVRTQDWPAIKAGTEHLLVTWPEAPEQLAPLWDGEWGKVIRLRERILEALVDPATLAATDVEKLYRLRRLLLDVDATEHLDAVNQALVDRGEEQPPPRSPHDRLARAELALQLSKDPVPALPWGYPSELVDVCARLDEIWTKAGRHRHVALAWQQVQRVSDDPDAWTREAAAWLAGGEPDKALLAANAAVSRATRPRAVDLVALNEDRQRADLAEALLVRARVREAQGDVTAALGDLGAASLVAGRVLDAALGERLDELTTAAARTVAAQYPTRAGTAADAAIAKAAAAKDPAAALAMLVDARFLATVGTAGGRRIGEWPEGYADVFARAFMVEAGIEHEAGRLDQARTAAVIATLLTGRAHPFWWATRGDLQDRNGEYDAAFASWSIARGLGVPDLDEKLARAYVGVAEWEVAANNLGGAPPAVALAPEPPPWQPPAGAVAGSGGPSRKGPKERPPTAPRLGDVFPSFSIETDAGALTSSALAGRVVVMTFWRSSCQECLQMLPAFGSLARRLRQDGRDVVVVGVSVDEDRAEFERVFRLGQRWAVLAWAPPLAEKFAVDRIPTTWVVDRTGVARYMVDHWLSPEELEAYVRELE